MGVFDDKKYDELDWVSQAVEPIDSYLNTILGSMPDETIISFEQYILHSADSYRGRLEIPTIIRNMTLASHHKFLGYQEANTVAKCFKLHVDGENLVLNFETKQIENGTIKLIKIANMIDDKDLGLLMGQEGVDAVTYMDINSPESLSRTNEILEYLGKCDEAIRTKSSYKKRQLLTKRLKEIFKTDEWKIKDMALANKVGVWIRDYVVNGNLAAISNFCRLKVMTHKDQAIYSIEEIV